MILVLVIFFYFVNVFLDLRDHEVASVVLAKVVIKTIDKPFKVLLEGLVLKLLDVVVIQVNTRGLIVPHFVTLVVDLLPVLHVIRLILLRDRPITLKFLYLLLIHAHLRVITRLLRMRSVRLQKLSAVNEAGNSHFTGVNSPMLC